MQQAVSVQVGVLAPAFGFMLPDSELLRNSQPDCIAVGVMGKFKKQSRLSLPFHRAEMNNIPYYFYLVLLQQIDTYLHFVNKIRSRQLVFCNKHYF